MHFTTKMHYFKPSLETFFQLNRAFSKSDQELLGLQIIPRNLVRLYHEEGSSLPGCANAGVEMRWPHMTQDPFSHEAGQIGDFS